MEEVELTGDAMAGINDGSLRTPFVDCCASSGTAIHLFPTSGGLVRWSGRHPVTTNGLWMLVVMRTMWSNTPFSWGSLGKLMVNADCRHWASCSLFVLAAVALATSSFRSGHSGMYLSQNCSAQGRAIRRRSFWNVSKRPVFSAQSSAILLFAVSAAFRLAPSQRDSVKTYAKSTLRQHRCF